MGDEPFSKRALAGLGVLYLVQGKLEQAEDAFRRAADGENDRDVRVGLAGVLLVGNRPDEAREVLDGISEFGGSKTAAPAWAMLGAVLLAKDKFDEAEIAYREAIECAEGDALAFAYLGLGAVATMKEDLLGAKVAYRKATELQSPDAALAAQEALLAIEEAMREEGLSDEILRDEDG